MTKLSSNIRYTKQKKSKSNFIFYLIIGVHYQVYSNKIQSQARRYPIRPKMQETNHGHAIMSNE